MSVETPGAVGGLRLRCLLGRTVCQPADPNLVHALRNLLRPLLSSHVNIVIFLTNQVVRYDLVCVIK